MPGFNQKGPMGQGPMTGRRMGRCTNFGESIKGETPAEVEADAKGPVQVNPESNPGRGLGLGHRRDRGGAGRGAGGQHRFRGGL